MDQIDGDKYLGLGLLDCAFMAYEKEGKTKDWIRKRIGNFCEKKEWYHTALVYYLAGNNRKAIDNLINELQKKDSVTAEEIIRIVK